MSTVNIKGCKYRLGVHGMVFRKDATGDFVRSTKTAKEFQRLVKIEPEEYESDFFARQIMKFRSNK